jgi:hypothetical protein
MLLRRNYDLRIYQNFQEMFNSEPEGQWLVEIEVETLPLPAKSTAQSIHLYAARARAQGKRLM